ncbi:MAG: type II toxin-antitoxin system VapC family toxin [Candidatus Heimdallarchaeota archaeon]|nr:type II toxin-antitoxin system VapC family toxin [Candidatus Heimdallarchaeota archaeon]
MILIDTSFYVAFLNTKDQNYSRAKELMTEIASGKFGSRITLDYVLDEAITVTWVRSGDRSLVDSIYLLINGKKSIFDMYTIELHELEEVWNTYKKYHSIRKPISFTDATLIYYAESNNIAKILSFDDEFDGILERVC